MRAIIVFFIIIQALMLNYYPCLANGRAKWLAEPHKKEDIQPRIVFKEVKNPPSVNYMAVDYEKNGEIPVSSNKIKLVAAAHMSPHLTSAWLGFSKVKPQVRSANIYRFRFIRLLLFPHHSFD